MLSVKNPKLVDFSIDLLYNKGERKECALCYVKYAK